jgi:hypothetical protein
VHQDQSKTLCPLRKNGLPWDTKIASICTFALA